MTALHGHVEEELARYLGLVSAEHAPSGNGIRAVYEAWLEQTHTHGTVVQGGIVSAITTLMTP